MQCTVKYAALPPKSACTTSFALDIPECQRGLGQVGVLGLLRQVVELRGRRGKGAAGRTWHRAAPGSLLVAVTAALGSQLTPAQSGLLDRCSTQLRMLCSEGRVRGWGREGWGGERRQVSQRAPAQPAGSQCGAKC